jgi:hypothetical protein
MIRNRRRKIRRLIRAVTVSLVWFFALTTTDAGIFAAALAASAAAPAVLSS